VAAVPGENVGAIFSRYSATVIGAWRTRSTVAATRRSSMVTPSWVASAIST
jgi:hypothetical protein